MWQHGQGAAACHRLDLGDVGVAVSQSYLIS